jgi:hypothetical protein
MKKIASSITLAAFGIMLAAVLAVGTIFPSITQAQLTPPVDNSNCTETGSGQYCLLEPLPIGGTNVYDKYDPKVTSAADYINLAIKIFISIIGALGVIMIVLGGVQYMTTDAISKKEGGKEMISNAIFGLILALVSWLLLNTINPHLIEIRLEPPKGVAIVTTGLEDLPAPYVAKNAMINGTSVNISSNCSQTSIDAAAQDGVALSKDQPWGTVAKIKANDDEYRTKLAAIGVTVNAANCPTVGASGCTSVYKLGNNTVNSLDIFRKKVCQNVSTQGTCTIQLSGGTECWLHSTHEIGSGKVDLNFTSAQLNAFINSKKSSVVCVPWWSSNPLDGCPAGKAGSYNIDGTTVVREASHYHISNWGQ